MPPATSSDNSWAFNPDTFAPPTPPLTSAPPPAAAPASPPALPALGAGSGYVTPDQINSAASAAGVDPDLYTRVIRQESQGRIDARSGAGAIGPAQLMGPTAADLGVDPSDPTQNLLGGAKYLRQMLDRYGGDETRALAAYNAGPGAVDKAGGVPDNGQTPAYVSAIMGGGMSAEDQALWKQNQALVAPSPVLTNPPSTVWETATPAQRQTMLQRRDASLFDSTKAPGSDQNPFVEKPAMGEGTDPLPAGAYVDLQGQFHPSPRSPLQVVQNAVSGVAQAASDTLASAIRLGLPPPGPEDVGLSPSDATLGSGGGPASSQTALAGARQEQNTYTLQHAGQPEAQLGRFVGQAVPGTIAALAIPEIEGGAGVLGMGGRLVTNALRGVAAQVPSVGTNQDPILPQLGIAALSGAVAPEVLDRAGAGLMNVAGAGGWGREVTPNVADLAAKARDQYGIKLESGQLPGIGKMGATPEQNDAWMRGVTSVYGDPSGDISPENLKANRQAIGGRIGDIGARNAITDPDGLMTNVGQLIAGADDLDYAQRDKLLTQLERIGDVRQGDTIPGSAYLNVTRQGGSLDRLQNGSDTSVGYYANQIRNAWDDALQQSLTGQDAQDLAQARWQYKNLMTVMKAAPSANVEGVLKPGALASAVNSQFANQATEGAGPLGDLVQIYQNFLSGNRNPAPVAPKPGWGSAFGLAAAAGGGDAVVNALLGHGPQVAAGDVGGSLLANAGPWAALATGAGVLGKNAASTVSHYLSNSRVYGPAEGIINRSASAGAPGPVTSALRGMQVAARPVEVPLSALAGVRLAPGLQPIPANSQ